MGDQTPKLSTEQIEPTMTALIGSIQAVTKLFLPDVAVGPQENEGPFALGCRLLTVLEAEAPAIVGGSEQPTPSQVAVVSAAMSLAGGLAPEMELAAIDDNEQPLDHALRLLAAARASAATVVEERDQLKRSLSAQKGATTRAQKEASALEGKLSPKPRKIGAGKFGGDPRALKALIDDADTIELVFSDGRSELPGIAPRMIEDGAWRETAGGLKLQVPSLEVRGGDQTVELAGYALLLDGDQVAWSARSDRLTIRSGMTINLKDDVVF